ncbi:MAG TPA: response regulator transcription factor [Puia sp.]|nr:response regulator transcription factor [Puia sp.]
MQDPDIIRISLVEDNPVNRNTFRQNMQGHSKWKISFIATNGKECLAELKGMPLDMQPHIIFMDIEMPLLNGIETISIAKSIYPDIHFIVLTVFDDDEKIFEAIKAGASGYLLKHENQSGIENAIAMVLEHKGAPMSPAIARKILLLLSKSPVIGEKAQQVPLPEIITEREKEILEHTVNGKDAKQIATILNISVLTVRKHIANIYEKLHVQSKAQIMQVARKNNWYKF